MFLILLVACASETGEVGESSTLSWGSETFECDPRDGGGYTAEVALAVEPLIVQMWNCFYAKDGRESCSPITPGSAQSGDYGEIVCGAAQTWIRVDWIRPL